MSSITVSTKSELSSARDNGYDEIIVVGKLASDLKKAKTITYAGAVTITALVCFCSRAYSGINRS